MKKELKPIRLEVIDGVITKKQQIEIANHMIEAIGFACDNSLQLVSLCDLFSYDENQKMKTTSITVDYTQYIDELNKILDLFEMLEEYEKCADVVKLKELVLISDFTKESKITTLKSVIQDL